MSLISQRIANELAVKESQVLSTIELLDEGATVPFIARYRKEVTGGLDDIQLRHLEDRLSYLRELDDRRVAILKSIDEQGKLTDELKKSIALAETKTVLEDLYLPYKKKRRTKAQIAREAGLEPLANGLLQDARLTPEEFAAGFIDKDKGVEDVTAALDGARQILMEQFAEEASLLGELREYLWQGGIVYSSVVKGKEAEGEKFADYFDFSEAIEKIPSHRALALFRGRNEGILSLNLKVASEEELDKHPCELSIASHFNISDQGRPADKWLQDTVRWAWKIKIFSHLDIELKMRLKEIAELEAIKVFADNMRDLLLAAPAGAKATMGLDPGIRTGVKVAVVDATGKLVDHATIYPHQPRNEWDQSIAVLAALCEKHHVELISIGNGTASRETDKLTQDMMKRHSQLNVQKLVVSEAGASVYSASELASREFPDLDVSIRGAVSIARRLQDPLAELVKIEPKAIGVGQYQHDVSQLQLAKKLNGVVEDCVNAVGVNINMASVPLLSQVAGLSPTLAENIVAYRNENGAFNNRKELLKVPRMGPKAFEQAGGFLRVVAGDNPLDNSSVHPEAYPLIEKIMSFSERDIRSLIGDETYLKQLDPKKFTDETFGLPTVTDILKELEKPGRDPRPEFKTAEFKEGVEEIKDLKEDMVLEGVVTNVTNFGAFVDIGVHQDGLVHISMLANKYVKDPREVVKAGDVVKVKVLEVDAQRKRIALTMRLTDDSRDHKAQQTQQKNTPLKKNQQQKAAEKKSAGGANSAMADALLGALKK
ncbi:MAG: RNA-binding transcriptional accessory protein [Gammaproteobacteria bacterium]|nr:RNA-binding transcriptional accessory protein [Gammaproteobacteria bacterium]